MKFTVYAFAILGTFIGGWLGSLVGDGGFFGPWSIMLSLLFGVGGVYAGYTLYNRFF